MISVVGYETDPSYPDLFGSETTTTFNFHSFHREPTYLPSMNYRLPIDPSLFNNVWQINQSDEPLLRIQAQRKIAIIQRFATKLIENSIDLDPEIARIAKDHFWDLV